MTTATQATIRRAIKAWQDCGLPVGADRRRIALNLAAKIDAIVTVPR